MKNLNSTEQYLYGQEVFVAFLDILGFTSAMEHAQEHLGQTEKTSSGELIFNLWRNAFLPTRKKLWTKYTESEKSREILNFVQLSDSLILYGENAKAVLNLACDIFGRALVWGVPIRGGLGHGELFHLEDSEKPGTALTLYGKGLIDAYQTEQSARNCGMRLFASPSFVSHSEFSTTLREHICGNPEYPWWIDAEVPYKQFAERVQAWWTTKNIGKWFAGVHRTDTEAVFELAQKELEAASKAGVAPL